MICLMIKKRRRPTSYKKGCRCELCRVARNLSQTEFRRRHPEAVKANNLKQFGLTYAQWQEMVLAQDNKCAVCSQEEHTRNQSKVMALAVDHDHITGKVRALLCHRCNRALGLLGDDADRVQKLADYRRRF